MVNINFKDNNNDSSNGDNKNNKKNYRDHLKDDETIKSTNPSDTKSSSSDRNKKKVSTSTYYKFSTILAFIITIPGVIVLFVLRQFEVDIIYQIISSSLAFFICIALSFKISSKLTKFYKN